MLSTFDVFCRLAQADLPDRAILDAALQRLVLEPGQVLFKESAAQPYVFVVHHGVVKMVYETANGDSWVKGFAEPGVCFASLTALAPGGRASYSAYAVTPAVVERLHFAQLEELAARHPLWQRALSHAYRIYGQRKEKREMELLTLSPEQRYLQFMQEHAQLAGQLRQRDIASYIRVTPVALSRIRARLSVCASAQS